MISDFDIFFLSYDEPNAEENYADLLDKAPWAQRVHGVKGFDAAHRACAEQSQTDWFVTVDGDSQINPDFLDLSVDLDPLNRPYESISWNGLNHINGLQYGNGGVKLWSKKFVMEGRVGHEGTDDPKHSVDFCWQEDYRSQPEVMTTVYCNGSPYQAFRVGFREGVKLTLSGGLRVPASKMKTLPKTNLRNIRIWSSVGVDRKNGIWAIYGARLGWRNMLDDTFDHVQVRDYDWFDEEWKNHKEIDPYERSMELGKEIERLTGIETPILTDESSKFFREMFVMRNV